MNLDEYVCYESDTVKKAMGIIDRNARGVVFVRNREDALVAAVMNCCKRERISFFLPIRHRMLNL